MIFTNNTINIQELPKYQEVALTPISPKYKKIILFNILLFHVLFVMTIILFMLFNKVTYSSYVFLGIGAGISFWLFLTLHYKSFHRRSYAVREWDVIYQKGILSRHLTVVPFNRIQHVSVYESFLARALGLAQIRFFTAGGASDILKISGLEKDKAEKIKVLILDKINNGDKQLQNCTDEERIN